MLSRNILKKYPELIGGIITLADVGASGGIDTRWKIFGQNIRVIGFEPDEREFEKLISDKHVVWFKKALYSDDKTHQLNLTKWQTNTSFLKPNMEFIDKLYTDKSNFEIIKTVSVQCERLDCIVEKGNITIDVLKLDTQGTELYILQGAENCLENNIFAVESEVEFVELYEGQPLFTDVDRFLRMKGYTIMDYGNITYLKGRQSLGRGGEKGFMISADALYFKSVEFIGDVLRKDDETKLVSIIMGCLAYGYPDYAIEICFEAKKQKLFSRHYLDILMNRLSKTNHFSQYIPNIWGKAKVAMAFRVFASLLSRTEDMSRINRLGNQIGLYKW